MDWLVLISLLVLGIIFIIIEVIFIPGTTFVGIFGFILVAAGIFFVYDKYGYQAGNYTLLGTSVFTFIMFYYSFKSGTWKKMANSSVVDSKVNEHIEMNLSVDDEGITVSALRPMGSVMFNDKHFEASTLGDFVDVDKKVIIIEIKNKQIIVEPLKS